MAVRRLRLNESVNNNDGYGVYFISDVDVKTNVNALYDSINNIIQSMRTNLMFLIMLMLLKKLIMMLYLVLIIF